MEICFENENNNSESCTIEVRKFGTVGEMTSLESLVNHYSLPPPLWDATQYTNLDCNSEGKNRRQFFFAEHELLPHQIIDECAIVDGATIVIHYGWLRTKNIFIDTLMHSKIGGDFEVKIREKLEESLRDLMHFLREISLDVDTSTYCGKRCIASRQSQSDSH